MERSRSPWSGLADVYGRPYDPGAALNRLGLSISDPAAWEELWSHLYHQGGVGEIAYAVVPELVRGSTLISDAPKPRRARRLMYILLC